MAHIHRGWSIDRAESGELPQLNLTDSQRRDLVAIAYTVVEKYRQEDQQLDSPQSSVPLPEQPNEPII